VYKCIFELLTVQQFLWLPFVPTQQFYNNYSSDSPYYCNASTQAAFFAFCTQFSLLGHQLCFFIITLDLRMAYTNPFTSYKQNGPYFSSFVLSLSLLTACALLILGDTVYGLSSIGTVWIQSSRSKGYGNYPKFFFYYFFCVCIYLYAIWATFQFRQTSMRGFPEALSKRSSIMERSRKYVSAYIFYDLVIFTFQSASFFTNGQVSTGGSDNIFSISSYLLSFRGLWSLIVLFATNYSELTFKNLLPFGVRRSNDKEAENVALEALLLQPHLNIALRAEILYFTTQGIMFATRELLKHNSKMGSPIAEVHFLSFAF